MKTRMHAPIYLDHNATTPIDPEVTRAMLPHLEGKYANPSSAYLLGQEARASVEEAREAVAALIGAKGREVIFTSGGSESNNMVLKGLVDWARPRNFHLVTSAVEHPAILQPALFLMELGVEVSFVPVDGRGRVDPEAVRQAIEPRTRLISVMLANNETGTLQPIQELASVAREHDVLLHTDAAQAVGKIPVDVDALGVDFLTIAGHKLYAPKGVGALFIREGCSLAPLIHGASQEKGLRAGTENTLLVAGLGAACRVAARRLAQDSMHTAALRDRLQERLFAGIQGLVLNGHPSERLPNTLNISVPGLEGARILEGLPGIMASTGAACHDRSIRLSHVLAAMGVVPEIGMGALRFSVGRHNEPAEIERAADLIVNRVAEMRNHGKATFP